MNISEPLQGRQYTISVDRNDRRLRTSADPGKDIRKTVESVIEQLSILGLQAYELSETLIMVPAPHAPSRRDWEDSKALEGCLELSDLPVRVSVGMTTIGGKKEPLYHPDIAELVERFPDFPNLPIDKKIELLRQEKLITF